MGKPSHGPDRRGHRMNVSSSLDACQPRLKLRFWGSDRMQGLKERSGVPLLPHPLLPQNPHQPPHNPPVGQPCPHGPQRSPSSLPSLTSHCVKTSLAYLRSDLGSRRAQASAAPVVFLGMHTALCSLARSPRGTTEGGW